MGGEEEEEEGYMKFQSSGATIPALVQSFSFLASCATFFVTYFTTYFK